MSFAQKTFSIFKRDVLLFILNVFTSIVIARKLGPELLGVWVIISLIPSYAEAFGRTKFDLAAVYFIGKKKYIENEILYHLNIVAITTGIFITVLIFIFKDYIIQLLFYGESNNLTFIYAILPIITLNFLDLNYSYLLISREDVKYFNYMIIIKALIGSGGACLLLLVFDLGLWSILTANVFSVLISLLFGRWRFNKTNMKSKRIFKLNIGLLRDFFKYSYKLYIGGIISYLNIYLMKSFLSIFMAAEKLAFYSMAQDRATLLNKISASANTLLYPRISRSNESDSTITTTKAFKIILILGFLSSVILAIVIKPLVYIMYGEAFLPMVIPFLVILPGILISGTCDIFTSYFTGSGRSDLIMKLSIFPLILQVILGLIFIKSFGIFGAAASFSLGMIFFSILQIFFFLKLSKTSFRMLIPMSSDYIYIYNFFKLKLSTK
jgi:O-antigen/teichoic acid export membrane protein